MADVQPPRGGLSFPWDSALLLGIATAFGNLCVTAFELGWSRRFDIPIFLMSVNLTSLLLAASIFVLIVLATAYGYVYNLLLGLYLRKAAIVLRAILRRERFPSLDTLVGNTMHEIEAALTVQIRYRATMLFASVIMFALGVGGCGIAGDLLSNYNDRWSFVAERCVIVAWLGDNIVAEDYDPHSHRVAPDVTVYHVDSLPPIWSVAPLKLGTQGSDSARLGRSRFECPRPGPGEGGTSPRRGVR